MNFSVRRDVTVLHAGRWPEWHGEWWGVLVSEHIGVSVGRAWRRVGVDWVSGDRWWFGRILVFAPIRKGVIVTLGIGEWDDHHHWFGFGPLSVSWHDFQPGLTRDER